VAAAFVSERVEAEVVLAEGDGIGREIERALGRARAGEIDGVVVGGGDGTVGSAAGLLAGTDVPLGVLPLGTLNHFAKDLGMPLEVERACAAIAAGRTRRVDVAEVNGRVFVNNSAVGLYPYMVIDRERRQDHSGLGKWPAMTLAFLRAVRHFPRRRLRVCVEGWTRPYRTPCLFVGNNAYDMSLLSMRRQQLDGGQLWLFVAGHQDRLAFMWLAARIAVGGLEREGNFETVSTPRAEILSRASRLHVSTDGEVQRLQPPLRYRSRPADLVVFAPE
jgi:diacylglycerol kinase family enzyme